ncbi:MAG: outer membrane beta-barrel protein [Acidobacteriota bacterium]
MRRSTLWLAAVAAVAGLCAAGPVRAQNRAQSWEVVPFVGLVQFGDEAEIEDAPAAGDTTIVESEDDITFGLRFGYHWTKRQMIEFWVDSIATSSQATLVQPDPMDPMLPPTIKSTGIKTDIVTIGANYTYNFFVHHRDKVVLFATGGLGLVSVSTFGKSPDRDLSKALVDLVGEEDDFMYNFGGGIRLFGSRKVGFRLDVRQVVYATDMADDLDFIEFTAGVSLVLGGP